MPSDPNSKDGIRTILSDKTWFGFDLDDTLHEFRNASRAATTHCLNIVATKNSQISLESLQERYQVVLKQGTSSAFVDGKTSHDYRRARFEATLEHFSLDYGVIEQLLEEYEQVLAQNLKLKPVAIDLLQTIKSSGRKIVIITEGPQDAQERAVRDLGIAEYIDFLATTNHFGVSKTSGLFQKVLDHLQIQPEDMAYVGDSFERDIVPTMADGIYAIHFDEKSPFQLRVNPLGINSLAILRDLL